MDKAERIEKLRSLIRENGRPIPFGANRPILIDDPMSVWWVDSGSADLFTVPLNDEAQPAGGRHHMLRVPENELIFGMDFSQSDTRLGILAVGSVGASLVRLSLADLQTLAKEETLSEPIVQLLESWISRISSVMLKQMPPKKSHRAEPGINIELAPGDSVRSDHLIWVHHQYGHSEFMGQEEFPDLVPEVIYPLANHTWIQAEIASKVYFLASHELIAQEQLWVGLQHFHMVILAAMASRRDRDEAKERKRLASKWKFDRSVFSGAMDRLAGVMNEKRSGEAADVTQLPVMRVCKAIGDAMGMRIRQPPFSVKGVSGFNAVRRIAIASHCRFRSVALRGDWWNHEHGPLVGYRQGDNRAIALLPIPTGGYELYDAETETRTKVGAKEAESVCPFGHALYRPFPEKEKLTGLDLLRFSFQGSYRDILTVFLMGVSGGLLGVVVPIATGMIFDDFIPGAERLQLFHLALGLLAAAISTGIFQITRGIAMLRLSIRMGQSVQAASWDRLLKLPAGFFREYEAGDLANRIGGIDQIRASLSSTTISGILSGIFTVFNFVIIFYYSIELALVGAVLVAIVFIVTIAAGMWQLRYQRRLFEENGKLHGLVYQLIQGMAKIRVAGAERRAFGQWAKQFSAQREISFDSGRFLNAVGAFNLSYPQFTQIVIFSSVLYVMGPEMSTGRFLAFNAAFNAFLFGILGLGDAILGLMNLGPLFERAKPILQTPIEIEEDRQDPGILMGKIEFSRVSFRYDKEGPWILQDISFSIKPGEFIALVGPSGGGKSTLLRLLMGFETPDLGTVSYDDQVLKDLDLLQVRRQIGVVLQDGRLLPGDIFTNIVGSSNLTQDDAWEAAEMAGLSEDIRQMPMGMNTVISEGGGTLSGGQRQRLMIARAIVKKPRILFFDEATSALDNRTQAIVSRSVEKLMATRVVIAHRLSTIVQADRIFVFAEGRLAQSGTYDELLNQPGPFQDLAKRQVA